VGVDSGNGGRVLDQAQIEEVLTEAGSDGNGGDLTRAHLRFPSVGVPLAEQLLKLFHRVHHN